MPAPKTPSTFDQHLGQVINGLARPRGGRPFLVELLGLSKGTIDRRMSGETAMLARELELIAPALHTTPEAIVSQALRNYGDGDAEAGRRKLAQEVAPMSPGVISLQDHIASKQREAEGLSPEQLEALELKAAIYDTELEQDEPDAP